MSARLARWRGLIGGAKIYAKGGRRNSLGSKLGAFMAEDFELTPETLAQFEAAARTCIARYVGEWMSVHRAVVDELLAELRELYFDWRVGELDPQQHGLVGDDDVWAWMRQRFQGVLSVRADALNMLLMNLDAQLEILEAYPPRGRGELVDAFYSFAPTLLEFTVLTTEGGIENHLAQHTALWLEVATGRELGDAEVAQLAAVASLRSRGAHVQALDYIDATIACCLGLAFNSTGSTGSEVL